MRYLMSGAAGLVAAGLIFVFMNHLAGDPAVAAIEPGAEPTVTILANPVDDPPETKPYVSPEPPEPPREPAPAPTEHSVTTDPVDRPVRDLRPGPGEGPDIPAGEFGPGAGDGGPGIKTAIQPQYPRDAIEQGIEGWVRVRFVIDEAGRPADVRVLEAVPRGRFERAAKNAVYKSRYYPAREDGQAVAVEVTQVIRFSMD